jgi:tungstate transport system substrate-binding protein
MDARRRTSGLRLEVGALICAALAACTSAPADRPLRLGTTFTVQQSGALALLDSLPPPDSLVTVIAASGQILQSAARGDLGVVITHAPSLEERLLVAPGYVVERCPFVNSRFAVVGPAADPAAVAHAASAADAVARIARAGAKFISRGDSSGTHVKELALWRAAAIAPEGKPWYVETGADQATTLHVADERAGYTLVDLPTLARTPGLELRILFDRDTALTNPYTLYVVRGPDSVRAAAFATWAMSVWRDRLLQVKLPDGAPGFVGRDGKCGPP